MSNHGDEVVVKDGVPGIDKSRSVPTIGDPIDSPTTETHLDWERELARVVNGHAYLIDTVMQRLAALEGKA